MLRSCILAVQDAPHPHTGAAIAQQLEELVADYGIGHLIVSVTHDNVANMLSAASLFANAIQAQHGRKPTSIRCAAHTLQLAANKILYENTAAVALDVGPSQSDVLLLDDGDDVRDFESISSPPPQAIANSLTSIREVVKFFKRSGPGKILGRSGPAFQKAIIAGVDPRTAP